MKKTKKAWKEYFEASENWKVCTRLSEYGMQITRLMGTKVFAFEQWWSHKDEFIYRDLEPHWTTAFFFVLEEDKNMDMYPIGITKTTLLEALYKGKYQEADYD